MTELLSIRTKFINLCDYLIENLNFLIQVQWKKMKIVIYHLICWGHRHPVPSLGRCCWHGVRPPVRWGRGSWPPGSCSSSGSWGGRSSTASTRASSWGRSWSACHTNPACRARCGSDRGVAPGPSMAGVQRCSTTGPACTPAVRGQQFRCFYFIICTTV